MKKDLNWFKEQLDDIEMNTPRLWSHNSIWMLDRVNELLDQLDEPEVLSQEWIDEHKVARINNLRKMTTDDVVSVKDLQNLLVPKQEEVDQSYKDGYEKGKQHATEKQSEETETVARVLVDYLIASAKLKLALNMEVEELEE